MHLGARFTAIILTAAAVLAAVAPSASAAVPWRMLSEHQGENFDEAGIVRGDDGRLHVVYTDVLGSLDEGIRYRTISPLGAVSEPSSVVANWAGLNNPDIELVGGVPHVFWGGQGSTDAADPRSVGQGWYASLAGGTWVPAAGPWTTDTTPYASTAIGTAVDSSGQPWGTWNGTFGLKTHAGLPLAGPEVNLTGDTGCCDYAGNIGRDAATGDLYINYYSNATGRVGMWTRRIAPALGDATRLAYGATPEGESLSRTTRLSAAPRTTGGVYSAHCATYPTCTVLAVSASSGPALRLRLPASMVPTLADSVSAAAAPDGRMWMSWANRAGVYATRSNKALTAWGPVQKVAGPRGTDTIWRTTGEGSLGFLDVVATLTTMPGDQLRTWHTRIKPVLTLTRTPASVRSNAARTVTFRVSDAGDAVTAKVRFRGAVRTTNAAGRVTFVIPRGAMAGTFPATATLAGYNSATAKVTVRR